MPLLRAPLCAAGITIVLLSVFVLYAMRYGEHDTYLQVAFLDVGQGDAIFIESPSGAQVLIDGGKGGQVLSALSATMGFFDRDIDMILATHPDLDHIGGLIEVLQHYVVDTVVMTENTSDTPAFAAFQDAVDREGARVIFARAGQVYDLGSGAVGSTTLTVLFPEHDAAALESNTASIVARLSYGESSYLLTGDAPVSIEEYLAARYGTHLASDVLKLGHHGSHTSTSDALLRAVAPVLGVISAGRDNTYGHPHADVLARLTRYGIPYKNTADQGSILVVSDGVSTWLR